jgi:hypothetical protein
VVADTHDGSPHSDAGSSVFGHCLDRVAWLADETDRSEDAVRLLAASQSLREHVGIAAPPFYAGIRDFYAGIRDLVRDSAGTRLSTRRVETA